MSYRTPSGGTTTRRNSIISVVCGFIGLWTGILGIILGIIAIIVGLMARRAGGGLLAMLGIALGVVDIVAIVLVGTSWNSSGYTSLG